MTLKFFSDLGITNAGWEAVYEIVPPTQIPENRYSYETVDFDVYPNPFKDELNIDFKNRKSQSLCIYVYSLINNKIYNLLYENHSSSTVLINNSFLANLNSGSYLIRLYDENGYIGFKVLLKK